MICHYSVMDKKMTAILYQNYSHFFGCEKCRALKKLLRRVFSAKFEGLPENCPVFPQGKGKKNKKIRAKINLALTLVRETGLEPVHQRYTPLKRARLPIPPLPRTFDIISHTYSFVNSFFKKIPENFTFLGEKY